MSLTTRDRARTPIKRSSVKSRPKPKTAAKRPASRVMHPRIRQRRTAVTKEAGLRRLKVAVIVASVTAVLAGAWGTTRGPLLDIDEVRSLGTDQTLLEEIVHAGNLKLGRAMTDVDPAGAAQGIARLPWVHTAKVERRWPGSIVVTITERQPVVGVARPDGSWALADGTGRVLAVIAGPPAGLPHVHDAEAVPGPGQSIGGDLGAAVTAAAALPESLRLVVGGVNLRPEGVELALTAGGVVRLGDPARQLAEKLRAAATVLKRVGAEHIGVLDVTVPRAPVLARG